jgi:hypothetical protein
MPRLVGLMILALLASAVPAWPQQRERRPRPSSNLIQIPSEQDFERGAFTQPRNSFSRNDATAARQMTRRARAIDDRVMRGICTGC